MRARTTVRNKGSYQYDILLTGYCDCLCRVHYAVAAAPATTSGRTDEGSVAAAPNVAIAANPTGAAK